MNWPELPINLFALFGLLVGLISFVTTVSFAFLWFDYANRNPELFQNRFRFRSLYTALSLITLETIYLLIATLWKPVGLFPREKYHHSDKIPVLLLHGLFHNRSCWFWVRRLLRKNDFTALYSLNLHPWRDIETLTELVARQVDKIRHKHKVDRIAIVGHSMGGIIARNFLQLRGGDDKIAFLVTLGSPHHGSQLAPFSLWSIGASAQPSSPFLAKLNQSPMPKGTKVTSIYTSKDNIIIPHMSANLPDAQNIVLDKIGHMGLIFSPRSLKHIIPALTLEGDT